MNESFFAGRRVDFYKPLTGKYRGVVEFVLVALYEAFFGQRYNHAHSMEREDLKSIVLDGLQRVSLTNSEGEEKDTERSDAVIAGEIIRDLVRHDYMEEYLDTESMRSRLRFTLHGRNQAKFFAEVGKPELKMPQRNVRNCRASLAAYLREGDPADLICATDFSRRIVHDFAEAEESILEEQRKIIAGASKEFAIKGYFDYIDQRFIPDHSIRASKDSVLRFHDQIQSMLTELWAKPGDELARMERATREARPDLATGSESVVLVLLREIRDHVGEAINHRMPRLLAAAGDFGSRASFVAMQASIMSGVSGISALAQLGDRLKALSAPEQDRILEAMLWDAIPPAITLVDESLIRVRRGVERTAIQTLQDIPVETREERLEASVRRALDAGFGISIEDIREQVLAEVEALGRSVRLSELPVERYEDLLYLTHAVEAACASEAKGKKLQAEPLGTRVKRPGVEFEDMAIGPMR